MDATASPSLASRRSPALSASALVFVGAAATILAALAFEHLGGYSPCPLCLEERYAYYFAVPASALALLVAAFIANAIAGIYHAGVEWKWWAGPGECAGGFELKWGEGGVAETPIIRCDEASWRFFGLSFAGWNAVLSAMLAGIAAYGAAKRH